jgi:glycosyltransferase involved in cell wall biosynthesis
MPELSVIMTTYKESLVFLKQCVDSVLNQTFKDYEFNIVIEPDEINLDFLQNVQASDRRVNILQNGKKLGKSESRNHAIKNSRGEYIAFVDSDDYCEPTRFEKQIQIFQNKSNISVVGANIHLIDNNNNILGERNYPELYRDIKKNFLFKMAIAHPTIMVQKKDLIDVGVFNNNISRAEDFELWLRFLVKDKEMYNIQEKLVYYRIPVDFDYKRGTIHYKNYYAALKEHSKFIWPFYERFFSLVFFFVISMLPNYFLNYLVNTSIIKKIKNIR